MNGLAWVLIVTISTLCNAAPSPGRNDVEDDINQLMSRFMFDDYEVNMANEYDYDQAEQEPHFADEQPIRSAPPTLQNSNYNRQNSPAVKEQEPKVAQHVQKSKEPTKESENSDTVAAVDPKLRDFTLIISKLLFHLSQLWLWRKTLTLLQLGDYFQFIILYYIILKM